MLRHLGRARTIILVVVLIGLFIIWTAFLYQADVRREGSRFDGFDVHVHTLLMGCFLALGGWTERRTWLTRLWPIPALLFSLRVLGLIPGFVFWLDVAVWDVAAALTLLGLVAHSGSGALALLRIPPMLYLGRVSYGMYLWHFPMISVIGAHVGGLRLFAATWLLSLVAATVSYYGVETRFHRRGVRTGASSAR